MGFVVGDWLLFCPGGNDTAWPNIGLDVGRPASGCPYQFPESALWGGLWVGGNDNLFLCGRAEASPDLFAAAFYQHVAYAVLSANSEGTNPQSSFTIIPVGNFITDGDAGLASDWDFQKMVWGDVLPFRYIAPGPEDTPQTVVPGASGLTALEATGTGVATLQYSINLNAIALE
jgi:hypothetical protein